MLSRTGGQEMPLTYCPGCDALIRVDKPHMGAVVKCRECGVELEVISTHPFEVYFPFDDEWEDEWEEEHKEKHRGRSRRKSAKGGRFSDEGFLDESFSAL
jgi:lysine biosynthesis protein LysW